MDAPESAQARDLIGNRSRHGTLQQSGDVGVELAVLMPQRCHSHHRGRADLAQMRDDLIEPVPNGGLRWAWLLRCRHRNPPSRLTGTRRQISTGIEPKMHFYE